jgi:BMFP domain-containing protein YqiC
MTELLVAWGPLLVILAIFLLLGRRQMKTYYAHVDEVNRVNRELVDVTKEVAAVSRQNLSTLQEIKSVLEGRKN